MWRRLQNVCTACGNRFSRVVDLADAAEELTREKLTGREKSLWRYRELLPLPKDAEPVSLGEGEHVAAIERFAAKSMSIFGSRMNRLIRAKFQSARMSVAVRGEISWREEARAPSWRETQVARLPLMLRAPDSKPTSSCRATHRARNYRMPRARCACDVDRRIDHGLRCRDRRRKTKKAGSICDAEKPYRIEGKKTLGYEIAEQLNWKLPDVILYPTGGGTGLIGMWKAFDEMEALGWIDNKRPQMFSVQPAVVPPIVRAFEAGEKFAAEFPNAHTVAAGLRVPKVIGDFLMLNILRESKGGAVAIDDDEMIRTVREVGSKEGLFIAPEGAACFAALKIFAFWKDRHRRARRDFQHRLRY